MKKPWLALLLNSIVTGAGYLYLGRRRFLGVMLILGELTFLALPPSFWNSVADTFESVDMWRLVIVGIGGALTSIAFAYDAWAEAKAMNQGK